MDRSPFPVPYPFLLFSASSYRITGSRLVPVLFPNREKIGYFVARKFFANVLNDDAIWFSRMHRTIVNLRKFERREVKSGRGWKHERKRKNGRIRLRSGKPFGQIRKKLICEIAARKGLCVASKGTILRSAAPSYLVFALAFSEISQEFRQEFDRISVFSTRRMDHRHSFLNNSNDSVVGLRDKLELFRER